MEEKIINYNIRIKEISEEELISEIKKGNFELFREITRRYNQRMYRTAISLGIKDFEAEDLIQQAYIAVFEKLYQFEGKAKFSTWLIRILVNECFMFKRKKKVHQKNMKAYAEESEGISKKNNRSPDSKLEEKETVFLIESSVKELPDKLRSVFIMKEIEGLSFKEVADVLGITEVNAKVRAFRAKNLMKKTLTARFDKEEILHFGNERCNNVTDIVMDIIKRKYLVKDSFY